MRILILAILATLITAVPAAAQDDAYLDPVARELVQQARSARGRQGTEIDSYTALVFKRSAARLRLPLRDRLLGREESVMRVRWSRTGETVIQQLGSRSEEMGAGPTPDVSVDVGSLFDPSGDRIYFGIDVGFLDDEGPREPADSAAAASVAVDSAAADSGSSDTTRASVSIGSGGVDVDVENPELTEFWIAHPLAEGSERYYRYRSGDTLTLRLPDGRTVRSVELNAIPREASFHHLRASLWIEPESGSLVRAIYRPARDIDVERDTAFVDAEDIDDIDVIPGMFRPIVFDLETMSVEYSLWNQRHWLPHRMNMGGYIRFGVVHLPFESEIAYRIEQVEDEPAPVQPTPEEILAEWGVATDELVMDSVVDGEDVAIVFRPQDPAELLEHELLPPPVWQESSQFMSSDELEMFAERLDEMIPGLDYVGPPRFELQFLHGGRGLVRYNRVEALSLGLRGVIDHAIGRAHATVRLGAADLHPNAEVGVLLPRRESAWRVEAYHRLATVEPLMPAFEAPEPALGFGNSLNALLFGRDDGLYYRATGVTIALEPLPQDRQSWRAALYAEQHDDARRKVEWNVASWLDDDRKFEPNIVADPDAYAGLMLLWAPWRGIGLGPQAGLELFGEAANDAWEDGRADSTFARARVTARTILPLFAGMRLGAEAAAGTAWGGLPVQYNWFLGGTETLRGYEIGDAAGSSMARARVELTRGGTAFALALFSDAGWAGERDAFDADDALLSAGFGITLMDGLVRLDLARALISPTGWRLHLHLNALL